jgi:hypothetical protein
LDPVAEAEFEEDSGDVGLDRGFADVELVGDLGVGEAAGDQAQDLAFAVGQVGEQVWAVDAFAAGGSSGTRP